MAFWRHHTCPPYHAQSGTDIINGSSASKFKESSLDANVGGVGDRIHTPHLVNPLANMSPKFKSRHLSMMKLTIIRVSLKS